MLQIDPLKLFVLLAVASCSSFQGTPASNDAGVTPTDEGGVASSDAGAAEAGPAPSSDGGVCGSTANPVFGNTTASSTDSTGGDTFDAYPILTIGGGTVECAHVLVAEILKGNPGDAFEVGIYDSDGATGGPGTLLGFASLALPGGGSLGAPKTASGPLVDAGGNRIVLTIKPAHYYWVAVGGHPAFNDVVDSTTSDAYSVGSAVSLPSPKWPTPYNHDSDSNVAAYFN